MMLALSACEPDIMFIGGRLSSVYDDLAKIAPVVYLSADTKLIFLQVNIRAIIKKQFASAGVLEHMKNAEKAWHDM